MNEKTFLNINELKDTLQDCNINFLIGSGMSAPYLPTLGKIEQLLTEIDARDKISEDQKKIVRASLYKKYFDGVIKNNIEVLEDHKDADEVLNNYKNFLKILNSILLNRKSTILSKQVNIFTTNVDIFFEKALENSNVEFNDGFSGRFNPQFDLGNFKKSYFKRSLHYDNTSELPVFNLMKVHGSLTWEKKTESEDISFSANLEIVKNIKGKEVTDGLLVEVDSNSKIDDLISAVGSNKSDNSVDIFLAEYEKLAIVNPTKEKFKDTVLNQTYYELLRIFSNELEKENTILFVMGFSFADEHIRKVTVRAANSNPTLRIYIFAHTSESKLSIETEIEKSKPNNKNINVFAAIDLTDGGSGEKEEVTFNLQNINEMIFEGLLGVIGKKEDQKADQK